MYRISELAARVGLSRAALLYYERLGLLKGRRRDNGYRVYTDADLQRLRLLQQLQAGGLSLKECRACLDGDIDTAMLFGRLQTLETEIAEKRRARDLLRALLGGDSLRAWRETVERLAPDLRRDRLVTEGFSSEDAGRIALLSNDMNDHDASVAAFMEIFSALDRWGPGTTEATLRALAALPRRPGRILEIGCGNGVATIPLAAHADARVTAIDADEGALERLRARAAAEGLSDRVEARRADMARLPAPAEPYDAIWAEGSAYIIGVERALEAWRPMLRPGGALVFSDMVWRVDDPAEAVRAFWADEYPAMTTVSRRLEQARRAGWRMRAHFDMGQAALDAYYGPLEARLRAVEDRMTGLRVLADLHRELRACREGAGAFGYEMFVLQRR